MKKAPQELRRYDQSSTLIPVPFADAIEDAIILQVHIWIMRRLKPPFHNPAVVGVLEDLQDWLGKPEGYEKLKEMV